jgi:penicillin-binding protein 1A
LLGCLAFGAAALFALTPSADGAAGRAQAWIASHGDDKPLTVPPPRISAAVLAVEDHRFYHHQGLDPAAMARAFGGALAGHDSGGSTIEMQLAKLLYTNGGHGLTDQTEQAALAIKLDRAYTKTEILLMYLNCEYFGHGFYGVIAASRGYFHTDPQELAWGQAALLAGLLKAPTDDDPLRHPERALARRQQVLLRLEAVGTLTSEQAAAANATGLQLATSAGSGEPVQPAHS